MGIYSFALKAKIVLTPQNHLHTLIDLFMISQTKSISDNIVCKPAVDLDQ